MDTCILNLDHTQKEIRAHGTIDFPCTCYSYNYTNKTTDTLPWHWHEEMEMIHVVSGRLNLYVPQSKLQLTAGDFAIINSNILHSVTAYPECELRSILFCISLITGSSDSAIARKYIDPLVRCNLFQAVVVNEIEEQFERAFMALMNPVLGYEFTVREQLSDIGFAMFNKFCDELDEKEQDQNQDNERMKVMIQFIHTHYAEHIVLDNIAKVANIGNRECLRCFQRTIHTSPIQYLLRYRVMKSANILLKESHCTISEIALRCGFESASNFSHTFKRFYQCTPKAYREGGRHAGQGIEGLFV